MAWSVGCVLGNYGGIFRQCFPTGTSWRAYPVSCIRAREKISSSFVLATALTERVLDAVVLVFIGAISLVTMENISPVLIQAGQAVSIISIIGLVGVLILPYLQKSLMWLFSRMHIQEKKLTKILEHILE